MCDLGAPSVHKLIACSKLSKQMRLGCSKWWSMVEPFGTYEEPSIAGPYVGGRSGKRPKVPLSCGSTAMAQQIYGTILPP